VGDFVRFQFVGKARAADPVGIVVFLDALDLARRRRSNSSACSFPAFAGVGILHSLRDGRVRYRSQANRNAALRLYHCDVLAALFIRLNQFGDAVVEGREFAFVVLSEG